MLGDNQYWNFQYSFNTYIWVDYGRSGIILIDNSLSTKLKTKFMDKSILPNTNIASLEQTELLIMIMEVLKTPHIVKIELKNQDLMDPSTQLEW